MTSSTAPTRPRRGVSPKNTVRNEPNTLLFGGVLKCTECGNFWNDRAHICCPHCERQALMADGVWR